MSHDNDGRPRRTDATADSADSNDLLSRSVSRRRVLRSSAAGAAVVGGTTIAGCLGGDDGEENGDGENGNGDQENGDSENGNGDQENGDENGNGDQENGDENDDENGDENDNGEEDDDWIQLFNGEDIDDWIPNFEGYEVGEDPEGTFVVEDGLLRVTYDDYDSFAVGHLFHEEEFSHYILHAEYRFVEDSAAGQIGAYRNNGLMLHGERPEEMDLNKPFPDSFELQFLGEAEGTDATRPNGDLCTPGTHAEDVSGDLVTQHCWNATEGSTYYGDRWVHAVAVVRGNELVQHVLEDDGIVLEFQNPQLDDGTPIESGTISIQSEGHPTDFRTIELLELDPDRARTPGSIPEEVEQFLSEDAA